MASKILLMLNLNLTCPYVIFLRDLIEFLGHVVDSDGNHTNPYKVKGPQNFPIRKTVDNAWSVLGLAGFSQAFIQDFVPLYHHSHVF